MYPQKRELKIQDCSMKFFVDISPGKGSEEKKSADCKCLIYLIWIA